MNRLVRSVEAVDQLPADDGGLVLLPERLVRLSVLGWATFEICATPQTDARIAEELAARFGVPETGDPLEATRLVVDNLIDEGLLADAGDAEGLAAQPVP